MPPHILTHNLCRVPYSDSKIIVGIAASAHELGYHHIPVQQDVGTTSGVFGGLIDITDHYIIVN